MWSWTDIETLDLCSHRRALKQESSGTNFFNFFMKGPIALSFIGKCRSFFTAGFKAHWFTALLQDSRLTGLLPYCRIQGSLVYCLTAGFKTHWFTALL